MGNTSSVKKLYCIEENNKLPEFDGKKYFPLFQLDKLNQSQPFSVVVECDNQFINIVVVLFKGRVLAFENKCPHQKRPSLHLGYIEKDCIVCPEHGWSFNLEIGCSVNKKLSVSKLHFVDVKVVDDTIYINMDNLCYQKWNFF